MSNDELRMIRNVITADLIKLGVKRDDIPDDMDISDMIKWKHVIRIQNNIKK